MAYVTSEARQELLDSVAEAIDEIATALGAIGDAYEQLDETSADTLEQELFRPLQAAYGRAKRTHDEFAVRHGHPARTFVPATPGLPSEGVKGFIEIAVGAVEQAESILVELQDSLSPATVGDPELRAGLAEVRTILDEISASADRFVSRFGR
jgi:hypothetical protein